VVAESARLVADVHADIGECPVWDTRAGGLLWIDLPSGTVGRLREDPASGGWRAEHLLEVPGSIGAIVPAEDDGFLVATGVEIVRYDEFGRLPRVVARIDADAARVKFNDGKCDPDGGFWVGTQTLTPGLFGGSLYRLERDGTMREMVTGVGISNGLGWSPDGANFYYVDTATESVDVFDVDPADGSIHNRRRLITFSHGEGRPDGLCVDDDGYIWVAVFYGGAVRRYTPAGTYSREIRVSAPLVTSCGFGGSSRELLFITTASIRMSQDKLRKAGMPLEMGERAAQADGAGGIFLARPGTTGPEAVRYRVRG
jgi:sugar lactone lactonase YvrE